MGIKLSFELSDRDLQFFRKALKQSREAVRDAEEAEIIEAICDVLDEIRRNDPLPDFVAKRLPQLELLIQMLADDEWQLPIADRERLLATFVYFADPEDILPDNIPVIGYLDDIIILELVARELQHVRDAYDDFCHFRFTMIVPASSSTTVTTRSPSTKKVAASAKTLTPSGACTSPR